MSADPRLDRYARLAVSVGVNLQPGQRLGINCSLEHAPFARAVARHAYAAGALFVDVAYNDPWIRRSHITHVAEGDLGWSPPWRIERIEGFRDGGAFLSVVGTPDAGVFAGLDGARVARSRQLELSEAHLRMTDGGCNWCVVGFPNEGWARTVFGAPELGRLWDAVAIATRLDEPDPDAAWREHAAVLERRAARLDELAFDELHYRGPGTDLRVGLLPGAVWMAAYEDARGIKHLANLPTEEVFTTPDAGRVSGTVTATYPLLLEGTVVRGLRVRFEQGRAVEVGADEGEALVRAHVATDEGAARLGEVALVDRSSRVGSTGVVFYETLFDENAASHIAFGAALLNAVPGARALPADERMARGINDSSVHTDFMIGSDALDVDGISRAGAVTPVMRAGAFVLG